jgi:hypothetical protein
LDLLSEQIIVEKELIGFLARREMQKAGLKLWILKASSKGNNFDRMYPRLYEV